MKKNFIFASIILLLSACASTPVTLNRAAFETKKIDSVVLLNKVGTISHQESDSGASSGAAGAGLLGVLVGSAIDSGVNSKRAKNMAPLLHALSGYDPNLYLMSSLKNESAGIAFLAPITIFTSVGDESKTLPRLISSYTIKPDFSGVIVALNVSHNQVSQGSKPYTNFYSSLQGEVVAGDAVENRQVWVDDPKKLIDAVEAGITAVVQMFVADYNGTNYIAAEPAPGDYPIHDPLGSEQTVEQNDVADDVRNIHVNTVESPTSYPDLVAQLKSSSTMTMRTAAKLVGEQKLYKDEGINSASIEVLNKYLELGVGDKDKYLIDGLSWCALNLGNTSSQDARNILAKVVASSLPKKLRSHAIHALKVMNGEV